MAQTQNGSRPGQDEDRKLFVGGLTLETTESELTEYFGKYGQIQSVTVKMNPQTGKSKGFAFVVFSSPECVDNVLAVNEHIINNKQVDAKKAKAKPGKIFVGGITPELTDDDIKTYFSQYGNITQVEMPFDKTKNQRKGFCFITFENDSIVRELLKTPKQTIKDKEVDVKKAATQPNNQMGRGGWGRGGGRGGRGGQGWGQGGWGQGGYDSYGGYGGYDNGYGGGYDYYGGGGGGYGGGYGADTGFGGGYGSTGGARGGGRGRGARGGGQRHQPY